MKSSRLSWMIAGVHAAAAAGWAQSGCTNHFYHYSGPRNSAELSAFLAGSQEPVIVALSPETRASLVQRMLFVDGIPRGMIGTDANIQALYASNAAAVFTAIYAKPTIVHSYGNGPTVQSITMAALLSQHAGYWEGLNFCVNCDPDPCGGECCIEGLNGCTDNVAMDGNLVFAVVGVSACAPYTPACYPNCDDSTIAPALNVQDFACFLNRFAAADPYANCDRSTTPPVLNVLDFGCFLNAFATGCS